MAPTSCKQALLNLVEKQKTVTQTQENKLLTDTDWLNKKDLRTINYIATSGLYKFADVNAFKKKITSMTHKASTQNKIKLKQNKQERTKKEIQKNKQERKKGKSEVKKKSNREEMATEPEKDVEVVSQKQVEKLGQEVNKKQRKQNQQCAKVNTEVEYHVVPSRKRRKVDVVLDNQQTVAVYLN